MPHSHLRELEWFGSRSTFKVIFPMFNCLFLRITMMMIKHCPKAHFPFWWIWVMFSYHFHQFPFQSCCVVFMDVLFSPILQSEDRQTSDFSGAPAWRGNKRPGTHASSISRALKIHVPWIPKTCSLQILCLCSSSPPWVTIITKPSCCDEANIRSFHLAVPSECAGYLTSGLLNICQRSLWRWLVW